MAVITHQSASQIFLRTGQKLHGHVRTAVRAATSAARASEGTERRPRLMDAAHDPDVPPASVT